MTMPCLLDFSILVAEVRNPNSSDPIATTVVVWPSRIGTPWFGPFSYCRSNDRQQLKRNGQIFLPRHNSYYQYSVAQRIRQSKFATWLPISMAQDQDLIESNGDRLEECSRTQNMPSGFLARLEHFTWVRYFKFETCIDLLRVKKFTELSYVGLVYIPNGNWRISYSSFTLNSTTYLCRTWDYRQDCVSIRSRDIYTGHSCNIVSFQKIPWDIESISCPSNRRTIFPNILPVHGEHYHVNRIVRSAILWTLAYCRISSSVLDLLRRHLRSCGWPLLRPVHQSFTQNSRHDTGLGLANLSFHAIWNDCFSGSSISTYRSGTSNDSGRTLGTRSGDARFNTDV